MTYSQENPCHVSTACYKDMETSLELWFNSENNPFRSYFENARRVDQKYIVNKFDLVIEDYDNNGDFVEVKLVSKKGSNRVVFKEVFDKVYGEIV